MNITGQNKMGSEDDLGFGPKKILPRILLIQVLVKAERKSES